MQGGGDDLDLDNVLDDYLVQLQSGMGGGVSGAMQGPMGGVGLMGDPLGGLGGLGAGGMGMQAMGMMGGPGAGATFGLPLQLTMQVSTAGKCFAFQCSCEPSQQKVRIGLELPPHQDSLSLASR